MSSKDSNKEKLVSYLLESLHYQDKAKEDLSIINQLRTVFDIPREAELRTYLIEKIDFSDLFAELLRITEPFAKMMSQIYIFLSDKKKHCAITPASYCGRKHQGPYFVQLRGIS